MNSTILERAFFPSSQVSGIREIRRVIVRSKIFLLLLHLLLHHLLFLLLLLLLLFFLLLHFSLVRGNTNGRTYVGTLRTYRFASAKECWKTMGFSSLGWKILSLSFSLSLPRSYYIKENFYEFLIKFLFN